MRKITLILFSVFTLSSGLMSQTELVSVENPVYDFLDEVRLAGFLSGYNSSLIPFSRKEIAGYLMSVRTNEKRLPANYRERLDYLLSEFEYDAKGTTREQRNLLAGDFVTDLSKKPYLWYYTDSSSAFFADVTASGNYREPGDDGGFAYGDYGFGVRGTLFGQVGLSFRYRGQYETLGEAHSGTVSADQANGNASAQLYSGLSVNPFYGIRLKGKDGFRTYSSATGDIYYYLGNNLAALSPGTEDMQTFNGYLRYATPEEWFSAVFGRYRNSSGFGYIDKLFLSDNCDYYDYAGIGLKYKSVSYKFFYGSIGGDSSGVPEVSAQGLPFRLRPLSSKNIVSHYLGVDFSEKFRMGLWESVIVSEQPFSFTYLNPISFLTSADLSSGDESTTNNNSLIGIEAEFMPLRNFSLQGSLLIDDLTFETLFEDDSLNENKFGWQFGALWAGVPGLSLAAEFTHLDPFVYSHRSNKSTFTHNGYSLGHALPPNSDEIAFMLNYTPFPEFNATLTYKHQRSGFGVKFDTLGVMLANYGGYITFGQGDAYLRTNNFLDGNRVSRDYLILNAVYEYTRGMTVEARVQYYNAESEVPGLSGDDVLLEAGLRVDL